jgi:hypothetical protein
MHLLDVDPAFTLAMPGGLTSSLVAENRIVD